MEQTRRIEPLFTLREPDIDIFGVRWSPDDTHIAAACSDASVRIHAASNGSFIRSLNCRTGSDTMPVTSVRWRPAISTAKTKNVLIATTADGSIIHWHATSGKMLHTITLEDNQALSSDYSIDGSMFAIGCKDMTVRIYDEASKSLVASLSQGQGEKLGHANRIFAVKWIDENTLASGGWDNNVLVWDIRTERVVKCVYGPHVCGESIDARANLLLTGSYHIQNQLQVWSLVDGQNVFTTNLSNGGKPCMVYSAQYSKSDGGQVIAVGGAGSDEAYFFNSADMTSFAVLTNMTKAVYSIDFANTSNKLAIGCGDGTLRVFNVEIVHGQPNK